MAHLAPMKSSKFSVFLQCVALSCLLGTSIHAGPDVNKLRKEFARINVDAASRAI